MAALTLTATSICGGGNHLNLSITGAKTASVSLDIDDIGLSISDEDLTSFAKIICRLCKSGKTVAQTKSALQAGITVSA